MACAKIIAPRRQNAPAASHVTERPTTNWGLQRRHGITHYCTEQGATAKFRELIDAARHGSV
uniref:Uncharacterized protein n=1 Tax=Salix viminalis TaxID=40686 RepID=A0A6N2KS18_SALVM